MKTMCALLLMSLAVVMGLAAPASADTLQLTPSEVVVLSADGSGLTKIAVRFGLSGFRTGANRRIDEALLDWPTGAVPSDDRSEYAAYPLLASWTASAVQAGSAPSVSEAVASAWEFTPADYVRNDGGLVRLDLTDLVSDWADGTATNYGVLVVSRDLDRTIAAADLPKMILTVRYGFRSN